MLIYILILQGEGTMVQDDRIEITYNCHVIKFIGKTIIATYNNNLLGYDKQEENFSRVR